MELGWLLVKPAMDTIRQKTNVPGLIKQLGESKMCYLSTKL